MLSSSLHLSKVNPSDGESTIIATSLSQTPELDKAAGVTAMAVEEDEDMVEAVGVVEGGMVEAEVISELS